MLVTLFATVANDGNGLFTCSFAFVISVSCIMPSTSFQVYFLHHSSSLYAPVGNFMFGNDYFVLSSLFPSVFHETCFGATSAITQYFIPPKLWHLEHCQLPPTSRSISNIHSLLIV